MQNMLCCNNCKTTIAEFMQTGLIGCSLCYTTFQEKLLFAIEKTQGKTVHKGKRPPWSPKQRYIFNKKFELRDILSDRLAGALKQNDNKQVDAIYSELKKIADLEKMYERQQQLEGIIQAKEGLERLEEEQNAILDFMDREEVLQAEDENDCCNVVPKESDKWKRELIALKNKIEKLENSICG